MTGAGRAPELVPNPRPRTPRFRPPAGPALVGLYPLHVALAALVGGMIAGPRSPAVVAAAGAALALGAVALLRSTAVLVVPLAPVDDDELERLGVTRPAAVPVRTARVGGALAGAVVALLAGAVLADERLAALDRTALVPADDIRLTGIVTAPPRVRSYGTTVVPVRLSAPATAAGGPMDDARAGDTRAGGAPDDAHAATAGDTRTGGAGETVLVRAPDRVRVPRVRVGDEVAVRGRLRRPDAFERRGNVHGVVEAGQVRATGRARSSPVDRVRRRAEAALGAGQPPERAALARGMVLGQDAALPDDLREAFRDAGLAHLLAASGQNVMLLAALVLAVATAAGVMLRGRLALALVAVALYVPIAGAGPSIQRAGIMGAAGLVAALAGRPASRWYALLLAAAGTLLLDPRAVEDAGWQLSFAAVLAILALHRRLRALLGPPEPDAADVLETPRVPAWLVRRVPDAAGPRVSTLHRREAPGVGGTAALAADALVAAARPGRRVRRAVAAAAADVAALTVAATIGTAPLLALHFEELSLVSLPANLLAAPAVAPVMWLGTLAAVLGGAAAAVLNAVAAVPLGYLAWLGRTAAAMPHASVPLQLPGPVAVTAAYVLLAGLSLVRVGPRAQRVLVQVGLATLGPRTLAAQAANAPPPLRPRWAMLAPAALVLAATGLLFAPGPARPPAGPTLTLLDVGQGDAVLLQDGPRAALFDTGRPGAPLVAELRRAGVERLDVVVVTHSSADHEGGLPALLDALPIGLVLDGRGSGAEHGGARFEGLPTGQARGVPERGQRFAVGQIAVEILWPPPGDPRTGDPNLTATVALASTPASTALLTADAESDVTLGLDVPDLDVLKVAHHGSRDDGLAALVARTTPRTALIPTGENTYGHPAPETLAALRTVPDVRRSDEDGTVRVPLGP